jgi:hypothetical protein
MIQAIGPKILLLKRHEPESHANAAKFMTASSYIVFKLTGEVVIEKAHAVGERAAPVILALVGAQREELRDEVALRAHDLDAVVARALGKHCGAHEIADSLLDLRHGEFARRVRVDPGLERRGRHDVLVEAVAAGVQDLQHDAPAGVVHGLRDHAVALRILLGAHLRAVRGELARVVG